MGSNPIDTMNLIELQLNAVLVETLHTNRGVRHRRVDVVPLAIDGDVLWALAKVWVKRVCVGHEAAAGVCVDLVGEEPRMQWAKNATKVI